jgi:hypothetical protein
VKLDRGFDVSLALQTLASNPMLQECGVRNPRSE